MTTIDDLLRNGLAAAPMKTAIRHKEAGAWREISYRDLHAQSEGIAAGLAAGKSPTDYKRVKKFTPREDEFPETTTRKIKRYAVEADVST